MNIIQINGLINKYEKDVSISEKEEIKILREIANINPKDEKDPGRIVSTYTSIFNIMKHKREELQGKETNYKSDFAKNYGNGSLNEIIDALKEEGGQYVEICGLMKKQINKYYKILINYINFFEEMTNIYLRYELCDYTNWKRLNQCRKECVYWFGSGRDNRFDERLVNDFCSLTKKYFVEGDEEDTGQVEEWLEETCRKLNGGKNRNRIKKHLKTRRKISDEYRGHTYQDKLNKLIDFSDYLFAD